MDKDTFKAIFTIEFFERHIQLWLRGEGLAGRLPQSPITASALQQTLAEHEEMPLMLEEALTSHQDQGPLSPTATDLIFTYLDEFRAPTALH